MKGAAVILQKNYRRHYWQRRYRIVRREGEIEGGEEGGKREGDEGGREGGGGRKGGKEGERVGGREGALVTLELVHDPLPPRRCIEASQGYRLPGGLEC